MSHPGRWELLRTPPAVATRRSIVLDRVPIVRLLVGATVIGTAALVLYPLLRLVLGIFLSDGGFGLGSIGETFASPDLPPALANTAVLIVAAGSAALVIGSVFAWLNERTDARMGWAADTLPIIPLMVPALATAIGWVFLLAPRAGFLNVLFRLAFDRDAAALGSGPSDIYSMLGMIWVTVVVTVPLAYLTVSAALRNLDPELEEASLMSGESPFGTLRKVTLPAVRNALATAAVLVVITIVSIFSVPVIIGGRQGIDVLSVLMWRALTVGGLPRFDQAIVLSAFMLAVVQLAILAEYAITRSGRHAKIGGKGRSRTRTTLGFWRTPARAVMVAYLAAATVLPALALLLVSLQGFWSPAVAWERLSLASYQEVFAAQSALGRAFANSLLLGVVTASALMVMGAVLAYYAASSTGAIARAVNGLTVLPASVPHVVTGVAFLVALGSGKLSLSGTLLLLFLAYVVLGLPQASRSAGAALSQVGREVWEGSLMSGASHARTFVRILLPLMLPGLLAGWAIVFVHAFSEISASVFLSSPQANPVTGPVIVDVFRSSGTYPQLAALALCVTAVQAGVVLVVQAAGRRRLGYLGA